MPSTNLANLTSGGKGQLKISFQSANRHILRGLRWRQTQTNKPGRLSATIPSLFYVITWLGLTRRRCCGTLDRLPFPPLQLWLASPTHAPALAALQNEVGRYLTEQFGKGLWSLRTTEKGVLFDMRRGRIYFAPEGDRPIAKLTLSTRKPWAIDTKYFSASQRPLYLTSMAVAPERQGQGLGRFCMEEACRIARDWPADAIRLDAWNSKAGAGEFYRKCGFRETGRATYRTSPLIYLEMLL